MTYSKLPKRIKNNPNKYFDNKKEWRKFSGVFKAKGGENYFGIGTHLIPRQQGVIGNWVKDRSCYFYIDDIRILEVGRKINVYSEKPLVLKDLHFHSGQSKINKQSNNELTRLIDYLKKHPKKTIEISGHADNSGNFDRNMKLSKDRAKSVTDYLISKGISAKRLKYKGYGSTKPIAKNNTAENKAKNRRVEVLLTTKD